MFESSISKGEEKRNTKVRLCEMVDHVAGVRAKLNQTFAHMLLVVIMMVMSLYDLTPRVFKEYEAVKQVSHSFRQQRRVLVFWRRRRF